MKHLVASTFILSAALLSGCGSTPKAIKRAEISAYETPYDVEESRAHNLMDAAEVYGLSDSKMPEDTTSDLKARVGTTGAVVEYLKGGSLLSIATAGLTDYLITPESKSVRGWTVALIDITDVPANADVDGYTKNAFAKEMGKVFAEMYGADTDKLRYTFYKGTGSLPVLGSVSEANFENVMVGAVDSPEACDAWFDHYMVAKGRPESDRERLRGLVNKTWANGCGNIHYRLKILHTVTSENLAWLDTGRKYALVRAELTVDDRERLLKINNPSDSLYFYLPPSEMLGSQNILSGLAFPVVKAPKDELLLFVEP